MGNKLFLACLILAFGCLAANAVNESFEQELAAGPDIKLVEAAAAPIRLDGESFSATPAKIANDRWIYIIYLNATQAAVVDAKKDMLGRWGYSLPRDTAGVTEALRQYYIDSSAQDIALGHIGAAHGHTLRFLPTVKEEADCRRLLGLEKKNCATYDECLKACYSSTSFCQPIALDEGKTFIMDVWRYENLSDAVREKYALLEAEFQIVNSSPSASGVADYRRAIAVVLSAQDELAKHRFNGLICKTPSQNNEALASAQKELDDAKNILSPMEGRNSSAQALVDGIVVRIEKKKFEEAAKNAAAAAAKNTVAPEANFTNAGANESGKQINFSDVWGAIASGGAGGGEGINYALIAPIAAGACIVALVPIAAVVAMLLAKKRKGL